MEKIMERDYAVYITMHHVVTVTAESEEEAIELAKYTFMDEYAIKVTDDEITDLEIVG